MLNNADEKRISEIRENLKQAMNLYSQAGDKTCSDEQYLLLTREARAIITMQVLPAIRAAVIAAGEEREK